MGVLKKTKKEEWRQGGATAVSFHLFLLSLSLNLYLLYYCSVTIKSADTTEHLIIGWGCEIYHVKTTSLGEITKRTLNFSHGSQIKVWKRLFQGTRTQEMTSTLLKIFWGVTLQNIKRLFHPHWKCFLHSLRRLWVSLSCSEVAKVASKTHTLTDTGYF